MLKILLNKIFGIRKEVESNGAATDNVVIKENIVSEISSRDLGISLFHEKRYEEAHEIFKKLNEENSNSENKFFLSLTTLMKGENTIAIELFEQAIETFVVDVNNVQHSISNMKIHFASQLIEKRNFSLAFKLLKEVSNTYCEYKILDETFLIMRGVPPFGYYLEILESIKDKVDREEFNTLISNLEIELGEDSKFYIDSIIRKIVEDK